MTLVCFWSQLPTIINQCLVNYLLGGDVASFPFFVQIQTICIVSADFVS